jgi:hypothetical protein
MIDEAREISGLSQKDLEIIERIVERYFNDTAGMIYRSSERVKDRIDARFDELEDKLDIEED